MAMVLNMYVHINIFLVVTPAIFTPHESYHLVCLLGADNH